MTDTLQKDDLPTSFGALKPVGHLMVGMPASSPPGALRERLLQAGWQPDELLHISPRESHAELQTLIDNAGGMAGFGYEITLMRRYLELAKQGVRWLLVKVDGTDGAARAAEQARSEGAVLAVHYRMLTVEELI